MRNRLTRPDPAGIGHSGETIFADVDSVSQPCRDRRVIGGTGPADLVRSRDHALLLVAIQTGLRLSELTGLRRQDVHLATGAHVRCMGKGRKERCTPLTKQTVASLQRG